MKKAIIVPNPFPCSSIDSLRNHQRSNSISEVLLTTYVSIGGGKVLSIPRLIKIVRLLNKRLEGLGINKRVILHIYGKDLSQSIVEKIRKYPDVRFKGYVDDFVTRLRNYDLFLAGYTFPELGHAVLEAMCVGVPVAKFTDNPELEEIIDGFNGILAIDDKEMVEKLVKYILNINKIKIHLAVNAIKTIIRRRTLKYIGAIWKAIIKVLLI